MNGTQLLSFYHCEVHSIGRLGNMCINMSGCYDWLKVLQEAKVVLQRHGERQTPCSLVSRESLIGMESMCEG
jgi:hypothetical protein